MSSRQIWVYEKDAVVIKRLQGEMSCASMDVVSHLLACKEIADLPRADYCEACHDTRPSTVEAIKYDGSWDTRCKVCDHVTTHTREASP